jgi:4-hydroxybenzoate polyprenyltransferase/phosphoserine phosphatase
MTAGAIDPASAPSSAANSSAGNVLCVDMDGTLIATDSLWESLIRLAKTNPRKLWHLPFQLRAGRAAFKDYVARNVQLDAALFPYRPEVLELLRSNRASGGRNVLATASHQLVANAVAEHLGLFDEVIASDPTANLKGAAKRAALESRFGAGKFDYVGNSSADLDIWKGCGCAFTIDVRPSLARKVRARCQNVRQLVAHRSSYKAMIKALRPVQWCKNLLLLVPLILAHKWGDHTRIIDTLLGCVAFSSCASAAYVLNDMLDIADDRKHAIKRHRPFAAGRLSVPTGMVMMLLLVAIAFAISINLLRPRFTLVLLGYLCGTVGYSTYFKTRLLVDVFVLAGLYVIRIFAGAIAADVSLTPWLMAFSLFLFISLAFAKRYAELTRAVRNQQTQLAGRNYQVGDLEIIQSIGPGSGYMAVLVFCTYINSDLVRTLYRHPNVLWLICPVLMYWITRLWFLARRHALHDDPVVFALTDRVSLMAGVLVACLILIAAL